MKPVENEELIEADIIRVFFYGVNETALTASPFLEK